MLWCVFILNKNFAIVLEKFFKTMYRNYLKIISILIFKVSIAQETPIDFSNSIDNFNVWGGSTFTTRLSPTESNNTVGEFFRSNSPLEQGYYIDLTKPIDLDVEDKITLLFYAFDPNIHTVIVKLERGSNPDLEVGKTVSTHNDWTELTFDFSTIGGTGMYDRLTIRIDDGSSVSGTFLIDNVNDNSTFTDPNALDVIYNDLVWGDEFNTNGSLDFTKWHHQTQVIIPGVGWANNEEQHYTSRSDNSFVDNGFLNIVAKKEVYSDQGITKNYTSARLNSKFAFTYGRVDVRAKLPLGDGTWPAIWTLGKNINEDGAYWDNQGFGSVSWPACGEIDIMEHGLGPINHTSSALHTPSSFANTINKASQEISDVADNFHIYSVNWSPNQITFLIDGIGFYTYNPNIKDLNTWPFDLDQYIILNVAMGGISGSIDPDFLQSNMVIDYVRVYQNNSLNSNDYDITGTIKLFPNPARTHFKMSSTSKIDYIEVNNILGKLMLKTDAINEPINIEGLQTGVYFVTIFLENSKTTKKLVIK